MAPRKPTTTSVKIASRKVAPSPIKIHKAKAEKPCKQIFKGLTFSFSGNFGEGMEYEKMVRWIKYHGGVYESEVTDETTHLICGIDDYKEKTEQVRKAWAQSPACFIVIPDYIIDCLCNNQKRQRAEKPYTLNRVMKRVHQSKEKQRKYINNFEEGVKASKELVDNRLHHIYYDQTGFEYKIVCTRINDFGSVPTEKYTIYLFESHARPCTYMVGAKLSRGPGRPISYWRDECHPKIFKDAFNDFKGFFFKKTGINWDDRCDGLPHDPSNFFYIAPTLGRPVGLLPVGKSPPAFPKDDEPKSDDTEMAVIPEGLIYDTDSEVEEDSSTTTDSPDPSAVLRSRTPISISSDSGFE